MERGEVTKCNLKPEPARDRQRARTTVSTWGRVREGSEAQEKEIRRMSECVGGGWGGGLNCKGPRH